MNRSTVILLIILMLCALSLVAAQQKTRSLYVALERSQTEERRLNQEWLRLEYEQRNLSKAARVTEIARKQLHMQPINPGRTQYVTVD
jgi:cell division protein FtsL